MLDHVSITVSDIAAAERFYDAIMKALGVVKVGRRDDWLGYGERARAAYPDRVYLTIRKGPKPEEAFGRHWCFKARWQTQVDAFWDAGIAAGGTDDGPPGSATITRPTMARSCVTPTATASKRSAIKRSSFLLCRVFFTRTGIHFARKRYGRPLSLSVRRPSWEQDRHFRAFARFAFEAKTAAEAIRHDAVDDV
jgi:catechol 2,3-dioxygenase-like lactoylglutathione lyase family enzyme